MKIIDILNDGIHVETEYHPETDEDRAWLAREYPSSMPCDYVTEAVYNAPVCMPRWQGRALFIPGKYRRERVEKTC